MNKSLSPSGNENREFSHCLREEFTRHLLDRLTDRGISINVTGKRGTGKTRLLEDIRHCNAPGKEIHLLDLEKETPGELERLTQEMEKGLGGHILLLNNCISDFHPQLSLLTENENLVLLCITAESQPLIKNLEVHEIPPLTRRQVAVELGRRMDEPTLWWFQANPDDKALLLDCIHDRPLPYPRLRFLVDTIINHSDEVQSVRFKRRLKQWNNEFNRRHSMMQLSLPKTAAALVKKLLGT